MKKVNMATTFLLFFFFFAFVESAQFFLVWPIFNMERYLLNFVGINIVNQFSGK